MDRSLFRFILRYSRRDQLRIVPFVLLTMVVYYASLDLPKTIINEAIQGGRFPQPDATTGLLGLELGRLEYLFALSMIFLGLIVVNGWLKFRINTMKGWMGERMLRRLRYALYDYILRFPLARFRRVKAAEMASMIKDEVEPLGGFIGEYDGRIGTAVARILAGGDVPAGAPISEAQLLGLEREAFLSLCGEERTLARIRHMLETGKPLRN